MSLAGVMVDDVKVLLFDEPLANLDPQPAGKLTIELIDQVQKKTGATVIIIEHRLEDVLWCSVDRIVLMGEGRILTDTTPEALLAGDQLTENGIREPLYITALKYAGVSLEAEKKPAHVNTLLLTEQDKAAVRDWYRQTVVRPQPPTAAPLLEVKDMCFGYSEGVTNLRDVSFTLNEGEMVSIVGRNGAGKSTLAKLICGFETPRSGSIRLNGRDLAGDTIKERAAHIG